MAFYVGKLGVNTVVIDNASSVGTGGTGGDIVPGKFATRATLPTGAAGYLAYVSDLNEFVSNTGVASLGQDPTDADAGVTWYKFITKPMDYKNEVILAQGTIAGGYIGANTSLYRIELLTYSTDVINLLINQYLPFVTASGGNHSTPTYAYYHQGGYAGTENSTAKHDWATFTVSTTTPRTNCLGGYLNSTQPGPKVQNTFGVILKGTESAKIDFATDSWTTGGYNATATGHGWGSFGSSYGYNWDGTNNMTRQDLVAGGGWVTTGSKSANTTDYGKSLNSKWGKLYSSGGTSSSYMDRYNTASNSWASNVSGIALTWQDQSTLMAQEWGYWVGYLWSSVYYATSYQHHYATETITTFANVSSATYSFNGNLTGGASAASSCTGPIP
jgi:hypothetical protein